MDPVRPHPPALQLCLALDIKYGIQRTVFIRKYGAEV